MKNSQNDKNSRESDFRMFLVITSACRETRFLADLRCLLECLSFRLVFHNYYFSKERI